MKYADHLTRFVGSKGHLTKDYETGAYTFKISKGHNPFSESAGEVDRIVDIQYDFVVVYEYRKSTLIRIPLHLFIIEEPVMFQRY